MEDPRAKYKIQKEKRYTPVYSQDMKMQLNICLIHANLIASTFGALPHGYLALGTACKKALPHFKSTEIYPLGPEVGLLVSHSQISQSWTSNYICLMAINILSFFLSRTLLFPHSLFPSSFLPFWLSFFFFLPSSFFFSF